MTFSEHTSKALSAATVNAPEIITEVVRAHDHHGSQRLEHLFEAHRLALELAAELQTAIAAEQAQCGLAAVQVIAKRMRAVAEGRRA